MMMNAVPLPVPPLGGPLMLNSRPNEMNTNTVLRLWWGGGAASPNPRDTSKVDVKMSSWFRVFAMCG